MEYEGLLNDAIEKAKIPGEREKAKFILLKAYGLHQNRYEALYLLSLFNLEDFVPTNNARYLDLAYEYCVKACMIRFHLPNDVFRRLGINHTDRFRLRDTIERLQKISCE